MYGNKQYCSLHLIFTQLFIYWLQAAFLEACQAAQTCGACLRAVGEVSTLKQEAVVAFCKDMSHLLGIFSLQAGAGGGIPSAVHPPPSHSRWMLEPSCATCVLVLRLWWLMVSLAVGLHSSLRANIDG